MGRMTWRLADTEKLLLSLVRWSSSQKKLRLDIRAGKIVWMCWDISAAVANPRNASTNSLEINEVALMLKLNSGNI